jgi:uncharacterized protein YegL
MRKQIIKESSEQKQLGTNHIFIVDCSGSMIGALPKLRENLKNKITSLVSEEDKISIIYFSGKNESDFVFDNYNVKNVLDLSNVKTGIDRYLQPLGATSFLKPLQLASQRIDSNYYNNLIFMTDGYNNDCDIRDVFKVLDQVSNSFDSSYFIEYGYYVDSNTLNTMAEKVGGAVVTAVDFESLSVEIENGFKVSSAPKIEVGGLDGEYCFGLSSTETGTNVIRYKISDSKAIVSSNHDFIYYGNPSTDSENYEETLTLLYGYFSLGNYKKAEEILFALGDVRLIDEYTKAYGKQKINAFKDLLLTFIENPSKSLFSKGKVVDYKINENAYTVLDMLNDLTGGENYVYVNHENFNYKRISAKRKTVDVVTDDVKSKISEAASIDEMKEILDDVKPIKFVYNDSYGCAPLSNITFNSSRANINLTVTLGGKVINLPENKWGYKEYNTFIIRSFNICKDGVLNLSELPVSLDSKTFAIMSSNNLIKRNLGTINGKDAYLIDFSNLPIINRSMIKSLNSEEFVNLFLELENLKAANKVANFINKSNNSMIENSEMDIFLHSIGITSNGYAPKTEKVESTDVYYAPTLNVKVAGLSSLPAIEKTVEKVNQNKKLNIADQLIIKEMKSYNEDISLIVKDPSSFSQKNNVKANKNSLQYKMAQNTMALILSRGWFADKEGFEDNKVEFEHPEYGLVSAVLDFKDEEVKI